MKQLRRFTLQGIAVATVSVSVLTAASDTAFADTGTAIFGNPLVSVLDLVFALGLVVLLAVLLVRFLARRMQVQPQGAIRIVAARQLAPNRSIQLVEVEGRRLLLGVGENLTLLADMTDTAAGDVVQSEAADSETFGQLLATSLQTLRERHRTGEVEREST